MITERTGVALALACAAACLVGGTAAAAPGPASARRANRWSPAVGTVPAPPPADRQAPATAAQPAFTDADFTPCQKHAHDKRLVPVTLKPDTDVDHLIVWISSLTCKAFVYSAALTSRGQKVTFVAPALVPPREAFRLVVEALNSVGLTIQPSGGFYQIIETARAKSKPIPLYGYDGHRLVYRRPRAGG
jgi:hypothetical protein